MFIQYKWTNMTHLKVHLSLTVRMVLKLNVGMIQTYYQQNDRLFVTVARPFSHFCLTLTIDIKRRWIRHLADAEEFDILQKQKHGAQWKCSLLFKCENKTKWPVSGRKKRSNLSKYTHWHIMDSKCSKLVIKFS